MKVEDRIRALLNDNQGHVFTDEVLAPFIAEAENRVPFIAASLICTSRGAFEWSDRFLKWPVPKEESDGVETATHEVAGKPDSGE